MYVSAGVLRLRVLRLMFGVPPSLRDARCQCGHSLGQHSVMQSCLEHGCRCVTFTIGPMMAKCPATHGSGVCVLCKGAGYVEALPD